MFHLLVAAGGWSDSDGTMSISRVYIKPNDQVGRKFYSNEQLNVEKLKEYPALLVAETSGDEPQFAKVANITNITLGHSKISIQYTIDNSISPISNAELEGHPMLHVGRRGLTHTCWEAYDVDLYKLLLHNQQKRAVTATVSPKVSSLDPKVSSLDPKVPSLDPKVSSLDPKVSSLDPKVSSLDPKVFPLNPKVFSLKAAYSQDENLVSIMMPFNAEFGPIYSTIQKATSSIGLYCVRADDIWEHHAIIQDIVNIIARAKVVICDCSGKNSNVFYEAGIAHTIGKEVILISQSKDDVPFNLRHLRHIYYLPNNEGLSKLSSALQARLQTIRSGKNA